MKTASRIVFPILMVLSVALGNFALAGPGPDEGFEGPQMHKALERLDLSTEQRKQVDELMDATRKSMRSLMERRRDAMKAMEPGKNVEAWDADAARKKADAYGAVAADMAYQRMQIVSRLRAILNDQQWKELQAMREERREDVRERGDKRGDGEGRRFERKPE